MIKSAKTKNWKSREDWVAGKKIGRPKQIWVWDREPATTVDGLPGIGHWEKV